MSPSVRDRRIAELFRPSGRFLRSVHLERDFADSAALQGYVLTDHSRSSLSRIAEGLHRDSGQRAWRITGNYGSGKSSFALLLAHWFAGDNRLFPKDIKTSLNYRDLTRSKPHLLPVLVTGSRQPLGTVVVRALVDSLNGLYRNVRRPKFVSSLATKIDGAAIVSDDEAIGIVQATARFVARNNKRTGLLLILDELGKFLEFATLHPEGQDVYLLQRLAELASRSGDNPIFVVGLLHQGFQAYAHDLSQVAQHEWEKVAARFEEIIFDHPLEQVSTLIASALKIKSKLVSKAVSAHAKDCMKRALGLGWFGANPKKSLLLQNASRIYPLHPLALPVLTRVFRRFGQNERSLFSFLLSNEPFGLQAFSERKIVAREQYSLSDLYDYVRFNFGHRLAVQSYRSHWNQIQSMIESYVTDEPTELAILKTVGILNLVNANDLLPTEEAVVQAVSKAHDGQSRQKIKRVLRRLQSKKRVLYHRGVGGGYCLWPYTSVDLETAYEEARKIVSTGARVVDRVSAYLDPQPIVARRHYITTGNLRHFDVCYCSVTDIDEAISKGRDEADGLIIVPLCESLQEQKRALSLAKTTEMKNHPDMLIAVPPPLSTLEGLVDEVERWEWVSRNTPELKGDRYASEEVSRQTRAARTALSKRLQSYVGLNQFAGHTSLQCFHRGKKAKIDCGRDLLRKLSDICDDLYSKAPRIKNELVNRKYLSSSAAAARMRLIERMLLYSTQDYLGMDPQKKPPEMSIYLSVLRAARLHRKTRNGASRIALPTAKQDESCQILPAMNCMTELLTKHVDARVPIIEIFDVLRRPPYGVRDGLIPLLLAGFLITYQDRLALYEKGSFLPIVEGEEFLRLTKAPGTFELQYCSIEGVRSELLGKLRDVITPSSSKSPKLAILDIVRPICIFAANLPEYVRQTKRLSRETVAVRDAVLSARDPVKLLFHELPKAFGLGSFEGKRRTAKKNTDAFVKGLKRTLGELKVAYSQLTERIRDQIRQTFALPQEQAFAREELAGRAEHLLVGLTEPRLKAFCLRSFDENLPDSEWIESLGSFLASSPPSKWSDADEETFLHELSLLGERLRRLEALRFGGPDKSTNGAGVRLTLTRADGSEVDRVIHAEREDTKHVVELRSKAEELLKGDERAGLTALSQVLWRALSEDESEK